MEPVLLVTGITAVAAAGAVAVSWRPARLRLAPGRVIGVAALVAAVWRVAPAGAVVPPPAVRIIDPAVPAEPSAGGNRHTVVGGECLWRIAAAVLGERLGRPATSAEIAAFWPRIYEANRAVIGPDPDLILVGQVLEIPEG